MERGTVEEAEERSSVRSDSSSGSGSARSVRHTADYDDAAVPVAPNAVATVRRRRSRSRDRGTGAVPATTGAEPARPSATRPSRRRDAGDDRPRRDGRGRSTWTAADAMATSLPRSLGGGGRPTSPSEAHLPSVETVHGRLLQIAAARGYTPGPAGFSSLLGFLEGAAVSRTAARASSADPHGDAVHQLERAKHAYDSLTAAAVLHERKVGVLEARIAGIDRQDASTAARRADTEARLAELGRTKAGLATKARELDAHEAAAGARQQAIAVHRAKWETARTDASSRSDVGRRRVAAVEEANGRLRVELATLRAQAEEWAAREGGRGGAPEAGAAGGRGAAAAPPPPAYSAAPPPAYAAAPPPAYSAPPPPAYSAPPPPAYSAPPPPAYSAPPPQAYAAPPPQTYAAPPPPAYEAHAAYPTYPPPPAAAAPSTAGMAYALPPPPAGLLDYHAHADAARAGAARAGAADGGGHGRDGRDSGGGVLPPARAHAAGGDPSGGGGGYDAVPAAGRTHPPPGGHAGADSGVRYVYDPPAGGYDGGAGAGGRVPRAGDVGPPPSAQLMGGGGGDYRRVADRRPVAADGGRDGSGGGAARHAAPVDGGHYDPALSVPPPRARAPAYAAAAEADGQ